MITGGAGFVGSNLAIRLQRDFAPTGTQVFAFDNLKRRGSELNLNRLRDAGIEFIHGDVRCRDDLDAVPEFDLLIECAAEPSVHSGTNGSPRYVLETNLLGTINCLEAVHKNDAAMIFLSTSRVFPIEKLNSLPFEETKDRFSWTETSQIHGFSNRGISESFSLDGPRSFYGVSKLSSEHIIAEYASNYGVKAIVNRCGIIAGPWQMGKVDQGVVTLWVARHTFGRALQYIGFGGVGKQVRDLLHIDDLYTLLCQQIQQPETWDGRVYNVGGGTEISVSLKELTELVNNITKREIPIEPVQQTNPLDVRIYITDSQSVQNDFSWKPEYQLHAIVEDVYNWIQKNQSDLEPILR